MGAGVIENCPPPNDPCKKLLQEIVDFIDRNKRELGGGGTHGLKHRFREQIEGAQPPGSIGWNNHEQQIKDQQKGLRERLRNYDSKGCGPPPPPAWKWATEPVPKPVEWKGPANQLKRTPIRTKYTEEQNPVRTVETEPVKEKAKNAAKAAAVVGAGYVAYRVLRFLPSLTPPLWWSIPANVVVP